MSGTELRTKQEIKARAAERHKARDNALPVRQRPVKSLWFLTAVLSFNLLLNMDMIWERHSELPGLLKHFSITDLASLHFLGWKFVYIFLFCLILGELWMRVFRARVERRRAKEQERAKRALRGEGIWPPPPHR